MKYEALIIGTGQAGTPLSFALADHGWSVALVEQGNAGGTCIMARRPCPWWRVLSNATKPLAS